MASAGSDWLTNPATQITWGLNYIQGPIRRSDHSTCAFRREPLVLRVMSSTRVAHNPVVRTGLQVLAFGTAVAFVLLFAVDPQSVGANASQQYAPTIDAAAGADQSLSVAAGQSVSVTRDGYTVTDAPPPPAPVPAAVSVPVSSGAVAGASGGCEANVVPTPGLPAAGSYQGIAYQAVMGYGWGEQNYYYLLALWNRESGWNPRGAQFLFGSPRHPSGASGFEDGPGLGVRSQRADQLGPCSTSRASTARPARPGPRQRTAAGTDRAHSPFRIPGRSVRAQRTAPHSLGSTHEA